MQDADSLIVFTLDDQRYALPLQAADRVVRIVAISLLSGAPDIVLGVVNVQGRVIPVVNMRRRFSLPEREIALSDQLLVAHTAVRPVALIADEVLEVMEGTARNRVSAEKILPETGYVAGVVKLEDGLIFIHDLDRFLSLEEGAVLDSALGPG